MITTNILQRTFQISFEKSFGTCFTVDVDERQYLITARHLVSEMTGAVTVKILHDRQWKELPVKLVGHSKGDADISVLAPGQQLSPDYPLNPSSAGLGLGQDVYFLGFPYGLITDVGGLNNGFPMPLIKKGIVSSLGFDETGNYILLDGHNNPGFSGGPVVFTRLGGPVDELSVAGVVSGYHYQYEPIYQKQHETPLSYKYNTGIIVTYSIRHAMDLIHENPIGIPLKNKKD